MEHLPSGIAQRINARVPYIVRQSYEYNGGFNTFPSRLEWEIADDELPKERGIPQEITPTGPFAETIQSWLYFGLLQEVLGDDPLFKKDDFVEEDELHILRITTKNLPDYLKRWQSRVEARSQNQRRCLIRAQLALEKARELVVRYCAVKTIGESAIWKIDPTICLSIMVLGETLSCAKENIMRASRFDMSGWHGHNSQGWGDSEWVLNRMTAARWCPRSIHILQQSSNSHTIGLLYAAMVAQVGSNNLYLHDKCSIHNCTARVLVVDKKNPYPTAHNPPTCTCALKGPEISKVVQIIKKNKIPLLRYYKEQKLVDVVEFNENISYGIVSHVWADGLGNPDENKLPICQLENIADTFKDIEDGEHSSRTNVPRGRTRKPTLFWIDTLAVPVDKRYNEERKLALKKMHETYQNARFTLVLDQGLMVTPLGSAFADLAMRVTMSDWMRRLWTLQEAALSRNLYFNFSNQYYNLASDARYSTNRNSELLSSEITLALTYYRNILGPERVRASNNQKNGPTAALVASVWKAVQWRTTSHLIHETLILAILLNMDTNRFADWKQFDPSTSEAQKEFDDRMQELMRLLSKTSPCAIPPGMIFLPGPKLPGKGYRWAPRCWLSGKKIDYPDPLSIPAPTCRLQSEGLVVTYSGFLLHKLDETQKDIELSDKFWFSANGMLQDWYLVERVDSDPKAACLDCEILAIITLRQPSLVREIAVLVAVKSGMLGEVLYTELLRRVWISRETRLDRIAKLQNDYGNGNFGTAACGEVVTPSQAWCVDGPDPIENALSEASTLSNIRTGAAKVMKNVASVFRPKTK